MPENDFEKQVQQIFGDMKLKPSEAVWPKVQERITREKKRRRVLLWLPVLLLLLTGGGYWIAQGSNDFFRDADGELNAVVNINNQEEAGNSDDTGSTTGGDQKNSNSTSTPVEPAAGIVTPQFTQDADVAKRTDVPQTNLKKELADISVVKPAKNKNLSNGVADKHNLVKDAAGAVKSRMNNKSSVSAKGAEQGNINVSLSQIAIEKDKDETLPVASESSADVAVTGIYQQVDEYDGLKDIDAEKELKSFIWENNKSVVKLGKRKSWEWGVSGQTGVSTIGKGLSGIFSNGLFEKAENAYSSVSASPDMSFLGNQNNYLAAAPPPASPVKTGMAWNAGGFGKWHIKERLALTFGAEYSLYTTNRKVGNILSQQNSINNSGLDANARFAGYYTTASSGVNYTNRYHFVQVPLGIKWQINKGIKLPVQLDAGVALAYLVNTNAVHYRPQSGAYYEDKSLFHKFQAGLYTGVTTKLFQHTERPLYVGPVVQYNLSSLTKSSSGLKQNFMYAGLKIQWVLWKN